MIEILGVVTALVLTLAYVGASLAVAVGMYQEGRKSGLTWWGAGIAACLSFAIAPAVLAYFAAYQFMRS